MWPDHRLHDGQRRQGQGPGRRPGGALTGPRPASPIDTALTNAIITAPPARDPAMIDKLSVVAGRALRG
ncbi:MAG: hypothetical protein WDN45_09455 [Caulobacteraceae bacterium]